ncbi:Metallo-dependent phosphatase-like protein [Amylostereum chailletii]|nr:Metallo-dependent phosphatase-like protein [Amylostereum chailletii]
MSDGEDGPPRTLRQEFPEDTIRIMLATDNHIGYLERDPIRGQDSINTFKEILQLAVKHDVDFVLLAGDLFHENRPSRDCLYQVMGLLRQYTMGDKPIQIELLSNPNEGKPASYEFPAINYEDMNFNVGIPVFSIHGNHDDPQGAGPEGALCALDILSVAGLVNYIGKLDLPLTDAPTEGISVRPVLLRKGNTHLGMYGIGNVKDARMHFELRSNRVKMFMPKDKDNWFNLLLLHQNRVKHGPQESVPEGLFDDSVDLVIWGHEHDCRIIPEPVAGKKYYISQPGSSVATSLAEGESLEKHVALLKIQGKEFQMDPIPLRSVRPFVMDEVVLTEVAEEEGFDVTDQMEVAKYLKLRVNELIDKAQTQWDERNQRVMEEGDEELPRMLPLVRLKVDTTGVSTMSNPIRFGQEFTGKIANPRDVLVFHRAKQAAARRVAADEPGEVEMGEDAEDGGADGVTADGVRVHALVQEYLRAQELQLLGEGGLADAIQLFVEKDGIHAIQTHVSDYLKALLKGVQANGEVPEEELDDVGKGKARADEDDDDDEASDASVDSMAMNVDFPAGSDFDSEPAPAPKKKAATTRGKKAAAPTKKATATGRGKKKATATGRGKKKAVSAPSSPPNRVRPCYIVQVESDEDEDEEDEEDEAPKPVKRTSRAAVLSQTTTKKAPAKKATATKAKAGQSTLSFAPTGRTSTRAAAGKAKGRMAAVSVSHTARWGSN